MATVKVYNNHSQPIGFMNVNSTSVSGVSNRSGYIGYWTKSGSTGITFTKDSKIFCYGEGTGGLETLIRLADAGIAPEKLMR